MKVRSRWILASLVLVVSAIMSWLFSQAGWERADQMAGTFGFFFGLFGMVFSVISLLIQLKDRKEKSTEPARRQTYPVQPVQPPRKASLRWFLRRATPAGATSILFSCDSALGAALISSVLAFIIGIGPVGAFADQTEPGPMASTPYPVPATTDPDDVVAPATEPEPAGTVSEQPELSAQTQYMVTYANETLRLPVRCDLGIDVDLDEPQVGANPGLAEFAYINPCNSTPAYIRLGQGVRGSLAPSASVTPHECGDLVRTSPLSSGAQPIRLGQAYCLNTSLEAAQKTADTWKMIIIEVVALSRDGDTTFKATAWDIPS